MAKKNPMEKILAKLRGGKSEYQVLQSSNGLVVSVLVKNGMLDLNADIRVGGVSLPMRELLHAAEMAKLVGDPGAMCVVHGPYLATAMGCKHCRVELQTEFNQAIQRGETVSEANVETA
jgi:hypothetical protein